MKDNKNMDRLQKLKRMFVQAVLLGSEPLVEKIDKKVIKEFDHAEFGPVRIPSCFKIETALIGSDVDRRYMENIIFTKLIKDKKYKIFKILAKRYMGICNSAIGENNKTAFCQTDCRVCPRRFSPGFILKLVMDIDKIDLDILEFIIKRTRIFVDFNEGSSIIFNRKVSVHLIDAIDGLIRQNRKEELDVIFKHIPWGTKMCCDLKLFFFALLQKLIEDVKKWSARKKKIN
jgi:hypothetical protein